MKFIFTLCLLSSFIAHSKTEISYALVDLSNSNVVTQKNEKEEKILASVAKLYTNFYALKNLGENFTYTTYLKTTGEIKEGILKGDLYLVGSGDPYLTAQHLITLVHQLQKVGINKIAGKFYLDDSNLAFANKVSDLGLEDQPDNPSHGALNVEFNRIKVWNYGKEIIPPTSHIKMEYKNVYSHGLKYRLTHLDDSQEVWEVHGAEKRKFTDDIPARDATLYTGEFFRGIAKLQGIELPAPVKNISPPKSKVLATHTGLPLARLASLSLEYSNNLIAETLLKTAASFQTTPKNSKESAKIMLEWFKKTYPNLSWEKTNFENGSGLTVQNTTTAIDLANWLAKVHSEIFEKRSFWSLLSISSHSGSLAKRLDEPNLAYRIYAKTGSLFFVNNLAGYFIGKSGKKYAFAVLTSDKKRKKLSGENSSELNKLRTQSRSWYGQSTQEIDELVKSWVLKY